MTTPEDPETVIEQVAERIAELRRFSGLTQAEVASRLGASVTNYQRIEHGSQNATLRTLVRIANVIGVPTALLFVVSQTPKQPRRRGRPRGS